MPFVNSVGLWLVTIMLLSSANKTSLYTLQFLEGHLCIEEETKDQELNPGEHLVY
jgi:hypothetical protein